jgi:hypothetical protein
LKCIFVTGRYIKHNPKGLVPNHARHVAMTWPYSHEKWEEELFTEDSQEWKEVQKRRSNLGETLFSSFLMEEKIKIVKF